jgi:hypothetical protein
LLPPRLGRQRCHVEGCRPHSNCIASWLSISFQKARIQRCATSLDAPQPMVSGKLTHHGHCQSRVRPCRLPAGPRGRTASRYVASAWRASTSQRLLTHHSSCLPADVHSEVGTLNLWAIVCGLSLNTEGCQLTGTAGESLDCFALSEAGSGNLEVPVGIRESSPGLTRTAA